MSALLILILASLGVAGLFLGAFIWAVRAGQYEDTCTPSLRILAEEDAAKSGSFPSTETKTEVK